ncbi:cupin domain-containing protein [Kitasatospora kifunensis]|uniref:Ribosomal protein L16 Arg81 hydroxylase n=1 Tax=Kitasatospora kifunensis TaxID=58351 RepID=A0A7W7VZG3_KITKI|nr:cupin domain-containing protein [Kitasatospora kifunensis]MBB4928767.1 ribosomal protein L16 Arg81 hydroxylase [Kitasatospora kifunensis]
MTILADREGVAPSVARPFPGLTELIHPVRVDAFQRDHWERRPLHIHRDQPDRYRDLLTLDDVDRMLALPGIALDSMRVVVEGKETPLSELRTAHRRNVIEAVYERYRGGSTVVLNALEQRCEPLQRLARTLGAELSARLQMNIYLTPAGNQGFAPHYDTHDVFVAQVHGSKHWRLAGQPYELPLGARPYDKSQPAPAPEREIELSPGDLLYLPRGTVHSATANEKTSVHITIGVHPVLFSDVLQRALGQLCSEDVRFRRGLPMGFASDPDRQLQAAALFAELLAAVGDRLSPQDLVEESVRRATALGAPTLRHHLTDLDLLDGVGPDTRVRRRPGLQWRLAVTEDTVRLEFHGKTVDLPARVADEVRYLAQAEGEGRSAASIPGDLDEPGRLVLVTALLREGFLTLAAAG